MAGFTPPAPRFGSPRRAETRIRPGTVSTGDGGDGTTPVGFDPADRDAYNRLKSILDQYGLSSLAEKILTYVQEGMSDDSIMLELQGTVEWKQRFSANEARRKAGLPVLPPAEYLATERAYRQVMTEAGLPPGFYDTNSDFTDFLSKDMSPAELKGRVDTAAAFVQNKDPRGLAFMKRWYTDGDLIAFALDPKRAAPLIEKSFQAASIGGIADGQGLAVGKATAEQLAAAGVDDSRARDAFTSLGAQKPTLDLLSSISGSGSITGDELAKAALLGDAATSKKVEKLKSAERG